MPNNRPLTVYPITTRTLEVLRTVDVTARMRRVTLGGPGLREHIADSGFQVPAFRSEGFDDEFKLILRHADLSADDPTPGPLQADGLLNWPRDEYLLHRTYTVRRWDPAAGEVDVDLVLHTDEETGRSGPAASWARSVRVGDTVQIAGPKMSAGHPADSDWCLIAGDETALPAIARWLEEWPHGARAQVFIEVADDAEIQALPAPGGVEITWLSRNGAEAGTTSLLLDAVTDAPWWPGTVFAWVAGEALSLAPLRRWLRGEKGLAKENLDVTGYWRRQMRPIGAETAVQRAESAAGAGGGPVGAEDDALEDRVLALTEVIPGFALRTAVTIGLIGALSEGQHSIASLAEQLRVEPVTLAGLIRYLVSLRVVEQDPHGGFALAAGAEVLASDHALDELDLDGDAGRRAVDGGKALLTALRGPDASPGSRLEARIRTEADDAHYVASALAVDPIFAEDRPVVLSGAGSGVIAEALTASHPDCEVAILAPPSEWEALRETFTTDRRITHLPGTLFDALPAGQARTLCLLDAIRGLPDVDAVHVLATARRSAGDNGAVVLFGDLLDPDNLDEEETADDLLDLALGGRGRRTAEEVATLARRAGLVTDDGTGDDGTSAVGGEAASASNRQSRRDTVGWGYTLLTYARAAGNR